MDTLTAWAKEAFEPKVGRALTDDEAAEFAMHLRRFAAFLIDCSKDKTLMARLRLKAGQEGSVAPSVAPRAMNSTSLEGRNPVRAPRLAVTDPPTASSRDALLHRVSSASLASASPAGQPAGPHLIQHITTGATADGSL